MQTDRSDNGKPECFSCDRDAAVSFEGAGGSMIHSCGFHCQTLREVAKAERELLRGKTNA